MKSQAKIKQQKRMKVLNLTRTKTYGSIIWNSYVYGTFKRSEHKGMGVIEASMY